MVNLPSTFWTTVQTPNNKKLGTYISFGEWKTQTFLSFPSETGASVGSGMKLAITAKKTTPAKNCAVKKV